MDVCKCIVPSRQGGTLNSRRAAIPLVRLVEGEERWETLDHPQGVLPLNWGKTELNRSVTSLRRCQNASDHLMQQGSRYLWKKADQFRNREAAEQA
ncbi:uncharacterized protein TNCV_738711 [Trichonephila clavipes]|nr:uncharacterized protein TNCV_738711 [Trichonephila clavipes]